MIFVTVGTHEQQFNRLIKMIDKLKGNNFIQEDVFIQTGYSNYIPKFCDFEKFISYNQMMEKMNSARIIITHGGPSSFMMAIQCGKKPIVVPRQVKYKEHVNNHQLVFAKKVQKKGYDIFLVEDIETIDEVISQFNCLKEKTQTIVTNNGTFNRAMSILINDLVEKKK